MDSENAQTETGKEPTVIAEERALMLPEWIAPINVLDGAVLAAAGDMLGLASAAKTYHDAMDETPYTDERSAIAFAVVHIAITGELADSGAYRVGRALCYAFDHRSEPKLSKSAWLQKVYGPCANRPTTRNESNLMRMYESAELRAFLRHGQNLASMAEKVLGREDITDADRSQILQVPSLATGKRDAMARLTALTPHVKRQPRTDKATDKIMDEPKTDTIPAKLTGDVDVRMAMLVGAFNGMTAYLEAARKLCNIVAEAANMPELYPTLERHYQMWAPVMFGGLYLRREINGRLPDGQDAVNALLAALGKVGARQAAPDMSKIVVEPISGPGVSAAPKSSGKPGQQHSK